MTPIDPPYETRLTLTYPSDAQDATPDAEEPTPGLDAPADEAADEAEALGVREAIDDVRASFMRMLSAHIDLLKAELSVAGKELGIIVALAVGALVLAILIGILLYVGTFLFMGDWLFGSMGWGIIHGTLFTGALIGIIAINLAGGQIGGYLWGLVWGVLVTVLLSLVLISNVLREGAVAGAEAVEGTIPILPNLLPTLVGLVVGA
ncbi:MAG: phage holin family protein, partial [Chloroflexota bacterium]